MKTEGGEEDKVEDRASYAERMPVECKESLKGIYEDVEADFLFGKKGR